MTQWFSDDYKYQMFLLWYNNGRPSGTKLHAMIPEGWGDAKPTPGTLTSWVNGEYFKEQAETLDTQVSREIEARMVKEKVDMLSRHADLGQEITDLAIDKIREKKDELSSNALVRLLIEGVRIERESRGIPQAIEKMVLNKSDEELLEEVNKLVKDSQVEILED